MKEKLLFVGNSVLPIYFSSAGKGPFMATKAKKKNICARGALSWGERGSGERGKFRS